MTVLLSLNHEFVYQDVDTPASSPFFAKVDLAVPSGMHVVGSGAVITDVRVAGVWTPVDSVANVTSQMEDIRFSDGPHPSDATKWRVMLAQTNNREMRVRVWLTAIGE